MRDEQTREGYFRELRTCDERDNEQMREENYRVLRLFRDFINRSEKIHHDHNTQSWYKRQCDKHKYKLEIEYGFK